MTRPWTCPRCAGRLLWLRLVIRCSACSWHEANPGHGQLEDDEHDGEEAPRGRSLSR